MCVQGLTPVCVSPVQVLMALTASPRPKQVLLFSATMPAALERLARSAVLDPVSGSQQHTHTRAHTC